jgi:hypothetical protein
MFDEHYQMNNLIVHKMRVLNVNFLSNYFCFIYLCFNHLTFETMRYFKLNLISISLHVVSTLVMVEVTSACGMFTSYSRIG